MKQYEVTGHHSATIGYTRWQYTATGQYQVTRHCKGMRLLADLRSLVNKRCILLGPLPISKKFPSTPCTPPTWLHVSVKEAVLVRVGQALQDLAAPHTFHTTHLASCLCGRSRACACRPGLAGSGSTSCAPCSLGSICPCPSSFGTGCTPAWGTGRTAGSLSI